MLRPYNARRLDIVTTKMRWRLFTKTLADPATLDEIRRRLRALRPDSPRQWGTMSPHQAVCHLGDALRIAIGDAPAPRIDTWLTRSVVRAVALHTPLPWTRGYRTPPGLDQVAGEGTAPLDFEIDRDELIRLHAKLAGGSRESLGGRHPIFGALSPDEWRIWAFRHSDHHLRQFGV